MAERLSPASCSQAVIAEPINTGINLFSVGDFLGNEHTEYLIYRDKQQGIYKKIVVQNNTIKGVVLYGDTQEGAFYNELMDNKTDLTALRPFLMFGRALCEDQVPSAFVNDKTANTLSVAI